MAEKVTIEIEVMAESADSDKSAGEDKRKDAQKKSTFKIRMEIDPTDAAALSALTNALKVAGLVAVGDMSSMDAVMATAVTTK